MAALNYEKSLSYVLRHEGGYVNHPKDPGGATNKGITQRVYDAFRRLKGLFTQSVRYITAAEVREIYREQYADAVKFNQLPSGVDYAAFDYAVNSGPKRAIQDLQRAIGVTADGILGKHTLDRLSGVNDLASLLDRYLDRRQAFVRSLKTYSTFGRGWENRIASVRIKAAALIHGSLGIMSVEPEDGLSTFDLVEIAEAGKADPVDVAVTRTNEGRAGAATGIGALGSAVTDAANQIAPHQSVTPVLQYIFIALTLAGVALGLYLTWKRLTKEGE